MIKARKTTLAAPLTAYRVASGGDAYLKGNLYPRARWNMEHDKIIYTAQHYMTAIMEKWVQLTELPKKLYFTEIKIPAGVGCETVNDDTLPSDWHELGVENAQVQTFGHRWYHAKRSVVLSVPSVVARPVERNLILNTTHRDFRRIRPGKKAPVEWDSRLLAHLQP